jgi:hypothetical protein
MVVVLEVVLPHFVVLVQVEEVVLEHLHKPFLLVIL